MTPLWHIKIYQLCSIKVHSCSYVLVKMFLTWQRKFYIVNTEFMFYMCIWGDLLALWGCLCHSSSVIEQMVPAWIVSTPFAAEKEHQLIASLHTVSEHPNHWFQKLPWSLHITTLWFSDIKFFLRLLPLTIAPCAVSMLSQFLWPISTYIRFVSILLIYMDPP